MATVADIRSHVTTRQWMELQHVDCCSLGRCFVAYNEIYCSEMLVVVQQGCKYVILAPLHLNTRLNGQFPE